MCLSSTVIPSTTRSRTTNYEQNKIFSELEKSKIIKKNNKGLEEDDNNSTNKENIIDKSNS